MSLETEQYDYITTDATFASLASTRLYPTFIPLDITLPAVAYQTIGGAGAIRKHDGTTITDIRYTRIQYTVTGETYEDAKEVSAAIRGRIEGANYTMGDVTVHHCDVTEDIDGYNQAHGLQTVRLDGIYMYTEA